MKQCKTLLSIVMAIMMLLTMIVPTLAGSITINNTLTGETYSAYKIFDVTTVKDSEGNNTGYSYTIESTSDWYSNVSAYATEHPTELSLTQAAGSTTTYVVNMNNDKTLDAASFAKYLIDNVGEIVADASAVATENADGTGTTVINVDEAGYYLVDSSLGALCMLHTAADDVTISDKNEMPPVEKKIVENNQKVDENDVKVGDVVNYETTITVKKGTQNYKLHDKMSAGLTLNTDSIKVTVNGTEVTADGNFTITTSELDDGCAFEIAFENSYIATLTPETKIVVTYNATVNTEAVIAGEGNTNKTKLTFGDNSGTEWDTTTTYVWEMKVFKYTGSETPLAGATFTLSVNQDGTKSIELVKKSDNVYRVAVADDVNKITEITTDSTGKFEIEGLDSGTYYLTETKAPDGYNMLSEPIKVVINGVDDTNPGKISYTYKNETVSNVDEVEVLNNSGTELPSTGGIGTTIFYCAGAVLALGAFVLLVTKKRMGKE